MSSASVVAALVAAWVIAVFLGFRSILISAVHKSKRPGRWLRLVNQVEALLAGT